MEHMWHKPYSTTFVQAIRLDGALRVAFPCLMVSDPA